MSVYQYVRNNRSNVSAGNFVDGIEPVGAFSAVAAEQFSSFNLSDAGDTERVIGGRVTAGYFDVFNLPAVHGRVFTKEEDQPGREQVVVLSHRLWTRRFGSDRAVVGRRVTLNEQRYDIIGVMPATFDYTADGKSSGCQSRSLAERKAMHDEHYLQIYGRLKPEATEEQALGELRANAAAAARRVPARGGRAGTSQSPGCRTTSSATTPAACSRCSVPSASCCSSPVAMSRTCYSRAARPGPASSRSVPLSVQAGRGSSGSC